MTIIQGKKDAIKDMRLRSRLPLILINNADVMEQLYHMGDALNRSRERLSSIKDNEKKGSEQHSHKHRSRK